MTSLMAYERMHVNKKQSKKKVLNDIFLFKLDYESLFFVV